MTSPKRGLIVVDVQNDFADPSGSLYVQGGEDVAAGISEFIVENEDDYEVIAYTRDWHIKPGEHFSSSPDYVTTWPVHCMADTWGAEYHEKLVLVPKAEHIIKGMYSSAYSGFEGYVESEYNEDQTYPRTLEDVLVAAGVTHVDVVGLATDFCVYRTALDARKKFKFVAVFEDLCAFVNEETSGDFVRDNFKDMRIELI